MYSFSGNSAASAPISTFMSHVSVSDLYSPRIGPHISSSRIGRPIVEIYINRSQAHECAEIGTETPIFLFWEYLFRNFRYFVFAVHMAKKSLSNPLPLLAHLLEQTNCLPPKPSGRLHYWGEEGTWVPGAATAVF
jgi:hypothetical protein